MGTPARHVRAEEVRRDEPVVVENPRIEQLNRTAESLKISERLVPDATAEAIAAFKEKIAVALERA